MRDATRWAQIGQDGCKRFTVRVVPTAANENAHRSCHPLIFATYERGRGADKRLFVRSHSPGARPGAPQPSLVLGSASQPAFLNAIPPQNMHFAGVGSSLTTISEQRLHTQQMDWASSASTDAAMTSAILVSLEPFMCLVAS